MYYVGKCCCGSDPFWSVFHGFCSLKKKSTESLWWGMWPSNKFSLFFCDVRNLIISIRERSHLPNAPREFPVRVLFFGNSHKIVSVNKPQASEDIAGFLEDSITKECSLGQ